jgi:hypothetical protein
MAGGPARKERGVNGGMTAKVKDPRPLTAADIEREPKPRFGTSDICRLHSIGREIRVRVEKLNQIGAKAVDMVDSINCLLREAEPLCDPDGFVAFKQRYCPDLGRSRMYELLAVEQGRKTVEQIRASGRERVAKHRAAQRTVTDNESVTANVSSAGNKVRVNGEAVRVDKLGPAQDQIAKALCETIEQTAKVIQRSVRERYGAFHHRRTCFAIG